MNRNHRREFLANVGRGMLVASVGSNLAHDLGLAPAALADGGAERLSFGSLEPLVSLMQETPANKLLPLLVDKLQSGTTLDQLVAAGALATVGSLLAVAYLASGAWDAMPFAAARTQRASTR